MRYPELTLEDAQLTIDNPDFITIQCKEHVFYIKDIKDKGTLLVYTEKDKEDEGNYIIICADWLVDRNKI